MLSHVHRLRAKAREGSIAPEALEIFTAIPGAMDGATRGPRKMPMQRLEDLEEYFQTTGRYPAKDVPGGLQSWAHRALNGKGSTDRHEAETIRQRAARLKAVEVQAFYSIQKYVADLEAHVQEHGRLPRTHPGRGKLRLDRGRLLRNLDSSRTDETTKGKITALLAAPIWRIRNPDVQQLLPGATRDHVLDFASYLDSLEVHVASNGYLPSAATGHNPRMNRTRLRAAVESGQLDPATRQRIERLLAATPFRRRRRGLLSDRQVEALVELSSRAELTARQKDLTEWCIAHCRLPSTGRSGPEEETLSNLLEGIRHRAFHGRVSQRTADFLLSLPRAVTVEERGRVLSKSTARNEAVHDAVTTPDGKETSRRWLPG